MDGKIIWITGSSSGIGEALARAFADKGAKIILSGRNEKDLGRVADAIGTENAKILVFDLSESANAKSIVFQAISLFGHIDILINNAGISQRSRIAETDFSVDKKLIEVNYLGTIALTKALLPHFVSRKSGQFAVVTSLMGKFGSPYRSSYCASKHALHGFFDVLRMEHERDNLKVTMICPGFVQTNIARNSLTHDGSMQLSDDEKTKTGMRPEVFAKKAIRAIEKQKFEVCIGGKETFGVLLKRFFPKLLHKVVLKSEVK
ncbi:SDR family oxidoreductase [Flavobacterium sp.]|uniref:SDR family oxidoreductase n=1 Tax=Flavobacterium sp. TaxID=239 RepID=UPI001214D54D|nr:SDR family oxidoreductase [Flavobacterium sp.]RZJ73515.1 MAG: SDR family oxidoreductase [Flavobacterium sp.]